jgi:hypothetical protein
MQSRGPQSERRQAGQCGREAQAIPRRVARFRVLCGRTARGTDCGMARARAADWRRRRPALPVTAVYVVSASAVVVGRPVAGTLGSVGTTLGSGGSTGYGQTGGAIGVSATGTGVDMGEVTSAKLSARQVRASR